MKNRSAKIALWGILGAAAIGISAIESAFSLPFLPPGAKPGLSNIITVLACIFSSFAGGIYISVIKSLFALCTRGATAFLLSFAGGICSSAVTALLLKLKRCPFSLIGISIVGAMIHNGMQLICAVLLSGTPSLFYYAPPLSFFAVISGLITGFTAKCAKPYVNNAFYKKEKK